METKSISVKQAKSILKGMLLELSKYDDETRFYLAVKDNNGVYSESLDNFKLDFVETGSVVSDCVIMSNKNK